MTKLNDSCLPWDQSFTHIIKKGQDGKVTTAQENIQSN